MFLGGYLGSCAAQLATYAACTACQCASHEVLRHSARVAWSVLFFLAMIVAWILRDFATPILQKIPWIVKDVTAVDMDKWFGQQAVYRVSMGNFLFFACMSLATIGVKFRGDKRDRYLHHAHPLLKLALWLLFTALPFLFPNGVLNAYSWMARVGSGVFLVIQMIILLDFVQGWNDSWVANGEDDDRWLYGLMGLTCVGYGSTLTLAGFMYYWFKPAGAGSCSLNIALITLTLLLVVTFSVLSLAPLARGGSIFPSSMIALYAAYLCFSALQSEPREYACNGLGHRLTAASGGTLALGMVVTLASVVYAAFRAGSNTALFTLEGSEEGEPLPSTAAATSLTPVTYNYSFFHLIFALASMYIAMLMTGWGTVAQVRKDRIDVGWASVWVKPAAEWVTGLLYMWTLVAPALFPERDFS
ncbi:hypothetical protein VOLCADRAFT_83749 [Volvox carteri f. nagariensis]|uniref:Serine incorporator n=1 Tax=Volvox carteri f. nagariensis TaxID=3068 RepID=D8UDM0_VOLCA|nr:uncharacterized protein VOLCADRAFT_83749 [Volvox carteri f. nagariensis]EFJ42217.1 hypothetical protein VOLCADRAFT_83749 [Volvox carteri f. nagariensis]|eukprot:XP_002956760.1 hypothetical protein VOLCADRAFT_83749 [Volvox carteri f. nagariensis]